MKTTSQYREDIAALMKKIGDMDAKCIAENRDPTEEEVDLQIAMKAEVRRLRKIAENQEDREILAKELTTPTTPLTVVDGARIDASPDRPGKDNFLSAGEQLSAIRQAGSPGGIVDPRLRNISAAATGLGETVPSDGGFLLQQDFATKWLDDMFETGILASRCQRIPISGPSNAIKIKGIDETSRASSTWGGIIVYMADEAAEKTASKPKFREIELSLKKMVGLCYTTDELLLDFTALESWIRRGFIKAFGFKTDDLIFNGTGAGEPLGILNAGSLVSVPKESGQTAATVLPQNLIKMYSRRFASMTGNYVWLYNQNIEPQLFTMSLSVGTGGIPVYMPPGGLTDAPFGRILGLPSIAIEQAETLGTVGDIVLANLSDGYLLAEKEGLKTEMSIHVRFIYDESVFRFVLRIDGQPLRLTPLTPYKGGAGATQSHFIALATRA